MWRAATAQLRPLLAATSQSRNSTVCRMTSATAVEPRLDSNCRMHFELWDTETANLVGSYDSEAAVLAVVREALRRHGPAVVRALALGAEHDETGDDARLPPILAADALLARVAAQDESTARRTA